MKKMILSSLLVLSILAIGFISTSFLGLDSKTSGDEGSSGDMVIIRMVEIWGLKPSKMVVSYGNGETEITPLKSFKINNIGNNMDILQNELNKFFKQNYELISSTGGNSEGVFVNTYILRKK